MDIGEVSSCCDNFDEVYSNKTSENYSLKQPEGKDAQLNDPDNSIYDIDNIFNVNSSNLLPFYVDSDFKCD